jgi:hypothetical protein
MRIDSSGNVGIGTSSPSQKLHVAGTGYSSSDFRAPIFYDSDNTGYYADPNGTSLFSKLIVRRATPVSAQAINDNATVVLDNTGNNFLQFRNTADNGTYSGLLFSDNNQGGYVVFGNAGVGDLLRLGGYSSISFDVGYDDSTTSVALKTQRGYIDVSANMYAFGSMRSPIFYDHNDTNYYCDPNSTSRFNNLNITGTLNAYSNAVNMNRLNWVSPSGSQYSDPYCFRWLGESDNSGNSWLELQLNDDPQEEFRIYGYSCSGYGCGSVSGNLYHRFVANGDAYHTGQLYVSGNVTAYYSDERLKTILGPIQNAIDKVKTLNGFYYEANETAQELGYTAVREIGVSAQEVQKVLPEIVKPAPIDNNYLTIDYSRLVPLLIEAVKEQQVQIEDQQKQIEILKEMINEIRR